MTPQSPGQRRLAPSEQAPTGPRALLFGALWLVVAGISAWDGVRVAIDLRWSVVLRIIAALVLVAGGAVALMLASDSVERWSNGRWGGLAGPLQWLTTCMAALAVVMVLGAPVTSLAPDRPGFAKVALDFLIDVVLGAIAGAAAVGRILLTAAVLGQAIWWVQRQLGLQSRAERWRPPRTKKRNRRDLARGATLGAAGLVLSAVCTALVTTLTVNNTGAVDTPARRATSILLTVALPVLFWFVGYLGVAGLFFSPAVDGSRLEIPAAYLAGLRDDADGARPLPALRLLPLAAAPEILSFTGNWGLDNNLSPLQIGRLRSSAGPPAPQRQGPWNTPFRSMLCSRRWLSTPAVPSSETAWTCPSSQS